MKHYEKPLKIPGPPMSSSPMATASRFSTVKENILSNKKKLYIALVNALANNKNTACALTLYDRERELNKSLPGKKDKDKQRNKFKIIDIKYGFIKWGVLSGQCIHRVYVVLLLPFRNTSAGNFAQLLCLKPTPPMKMIKYAALAVLLSACTPAIAQHAPGWDWAISGTNNNTPGTEAWRSTTDAEGHIYVTGLFEDSVMLGDKKLTAIGEKDLFVVKYTTTGHAQWAINIGGNFDYQVFDIKTDKEGNVYLTGAFLGTAHFATTTVNSLPVRGMFLVKYNPAGQEQWVRTVKGSGDVTSYSLTIDNTGKIYIAGTFLSTVDFGQMQLQSVGDQDVYIAQYDKDGNFGWAQREGGTSYDYIRGITCDKNNNIFVTGVFDENITLGGNFIKSIGSYDVFLAKYSNTGQFNWARTGGSDGGDFATGIKTDADGNVHIIGETDGMGPLKFGATTLAKDKRIFLAKYNNDGQLLWAKGDGSANQVNCPGMGLDVAGNIFIAGDFVKETTLCNEHLTSLGYSDVYVAKYDKDGNSQWVTALRTQTDAYATGLSIDRNNQVIITGFYNGAEYTFGTHTLPSPGTGNNMFVAKMAPYATRVKDNGTALAEKAILYPNPTTGKIFIPKGYNLATVYDISGRIAYAATVENGSIELAGLQNGVYTVHLTGTKGTATQKITVLQ